VVMAGVYGEVLGGHYGISVARRGFRKAMSVGKGLLLEDASIPDVATVRQLLSWKAHAKALVSLARLPVECDRRRSRPTTSDIEAALHRLQARGVRIRPTCSKPLSPKRAARGISTPRSPVAGLTSMSPFRSVIAPSSRLASQLPAGVKIHNAVTRDMLLRHAPDLLEGSVGCYARGGRQTPHRAGVSRGLRRAMETVRTRLHERYPQRDPRARNTAGSISSSCAGAVSFGTS
jgi:hypothetical protein